MPRSFSRLPALIRAACSGLDPLGGLDAREKQQPRRAHPRSTCASRELQRAVSPGILGDHLAQDV